jgi:hypothetical protein
MSDEIVITRGNQPKQPEVSTFPTEIVDLPSGGKFYSSENPLSKGSVEMKYMTAKEEDILTNQNLLKKGLAVDKLLESLIVDKSINLDTLLSGDKNALIFAARRLAYGDSYGPFDITCNGCSSNNKVTIDLGKLNFRELNESVDLNEYGEYSFLLPVSKNTITFKMLTSGDEKDIEKEISSLSKIKKGDSSGEMTARMRKMIKSVNGNRSPEVINKFVENEFLSRDSFPFRQFLKNITPDLDTVTSYVCESCGNEERVAVPITAQFFWPDSAV